MNFTSINNTGLLLLEMYIVCFASDHDYDIHNLGRWETN